jgi:ADP-ribose pyrophosphatase
VTDSPVNSGGFSQLSETELARNPVFRFMSVTFAAPSGEQFERQIVRHPGAVAVLPLHDDGTVTLVRQYRGAINDTIIEIPAGVLDVPGEDLAAAAARELREEVGLSATSMRYLTSYQAAIGFSDERITLFLATGLTFVGVDLQGPEESHMVQLRVSLAEAIEMVRDGVICDSKTAIALMYSQLFPRS